MDSTSPGASYSGFKFWQDDRYEQRQCGLATKPRVLISGAGDGALQDLARIATGLRSAKEVYSQIFHGTNSTVLKDAIEQIRAAEIEPLQIWAWGDRHDHDFQNHLHGVYQAVVRDLLKENDVKDNLKRLLSDFADRISSLKLVYRCQHLTAFYPLNRFVAFLLDAYMTKFGLGPLLVPAKRVRAVDSADRHVCRGPLTCHGLPHTVWLDDALDCDGALSPHAASETADVVIIRHGIDSSSLPPLPDLAQPRQILPPCVL